jgi:hypothetical protein
MISFNGIHIRGYLKLLPYSLEFTVMTDVVSMQWNKIRTMMLLVNITPISSSKYRPGLNDRTVSDLRCFSVFLNFSERTHDVNRRLDVAYKHTDFTV